MRRLGFHAVIFGAYLALALLVTFPLVLDLSGQLIGHHTGDAYEMGHHIWWFKHAIETGEPLFYQTLLAYPDGIQGISLWANPLQFFPAWLLALVMPVAAAYNLHILLAMALNGWALFVLMRDRLPDRHGLWPALVAGAAFMTFPVFQGHLFAGHAGLMVMWPVPLLVLALFRWLDTRRARWFAASVALFVVSPWGHSLQVIYVLLPLFGLITLGRLLRRDWGGALRVIAVGIVGGVLLLIFLLPVAADTFGGDTYTGDGGYVAFSADLLGVLTPSFEHVLLGGLPHTRPILGTNLGEGLTYIGITGLILMAVAVWARREARGWLALALLAVVLAWGPILNLLGQPLTLTLDGYASYMTSPFAGFYTLPGLSLARTPGRFSFALALAAAVLIGYGVHAIAARWPRTQRVVIPLLAALIVFEYQSFWPFPTVPADVPPAIRALAARDDVRAVLDVPWGNLLAAKDGLYLQTAHEKPLIAGQVTRRTPVSPAKLTLLEETLDPALLDQAGVDVIIVHKQWADDAQQERMRALGAPLYEDARFAVYDVPDPVSEAQFTARFPDTGAITARLDAYFYAPAPGWSLFRADLSADDVPLDVRVDGARVQRLTVDGGARLLIPVQHTDAGYVTLELGVTPACPRPISPAQTCRAVTPQDLRWWPVTGEATGAVALGGGFALAGALVTVDPDAPRIDVLLDWRFDTPPLESDVRFVKVFDADGQQIAGDDAPRHLLAGDGRLSEVVSLAIPSEAAGPFAVYAGWYTFPDLTRRTVASDAPGAQDGLIYLGTLADVPR